VESPLGVPIVGSIPAEKIFWGGPARWSELPGLAAGGGAARHTSRRYGPAWPSACSDDFRRSLLGAIALELSADQPSTASQNRALAAAETYGANGEGELVQPGVPQAVA